MRKRLRKKLAKKWLIKVVKSMPILFERDDEFYKAIEVPGNEIYIKKDMIVKL